METTLFETGPVLRESAANPVVFETYREINTFLYLSLFAVPCNQVSLEEKSRLKSRLKSHENQLLKSTTFSAMTLKIL